MSFVVGVGGSGSGSGGDGGGSQHHDGSETDRKKKRYHRHTAQQIQRLESYYTIPFFYLCLGEIFLFCFHF